MDRSQTVAGAAAVDLLEVDAWDECHAAYQAYLEASRIHSRSLRSALEGRAFTGAAGAVEAGARARDLLVQWLRKCEAVSQELAWGVRARQATSAREAQRPLGKSM